MVNRATDPDLQTLQSPVARHGAALLAAASLGLERHRAAVLAQDSSATARALEALAPVLTELMELVGPPPGGGPPLASGAALMPPADAARLAQRVAQVREQLFLNQVLVANGMAVTDHYALCISQASSEDGPGLISEVA